MPFLTCISYPGGCIYGGGGRMVIYTSLRGPPIAFSETIAPGLRCNEVTGCFPWYAHGILVHKPICQECGRICIGLFFVFYTGYSSGNGNAETREAGPFVYLAFLCFFNDNID